MAEDREDLLRRYRESRAKLLQAIESLTDEQMSEPSLDGWAVKDHLAHIALWDDIRADDVERISAGFESAWKMTDEQNPMWYDPEHGLVDSPAHPGQFGLLPEAAEAVRRVNQLGLPVVVVSNQPGIAKGKLSPALLDAITAATPPALDPTRYGGADLRSDHEDEHAGWIARWRGEKGI